LVAIKFDFDLTPARTSNPTNFIQIRKEMVLMVSPIRK
jgi:hypothetical protein